MGCLRALFVQVGCLVLLAAALVFGFLYRRPLWDAYKRFRGQRPAAEMAFSVPVEGGVRSAREQLRRLTVRGGPAYVDLTAADVAALLDRQLAEPSGGILDSVGVALDSGVVLVRGVLDLDRVPGGVLGPLAGRLGGRERIEAGGALAADSGALRWLPTRLSIKDFPFPRRTITPLLRALHLAVGEDGSLAIPGVDGVGDVRVSPSVVRLYRLVRQ